jgi:ATP-dependent Lon protease
MKRLKAMQPSMADYQVLRNYLETLSEIPWNISSPEEINISKAKQQLDNDHFGMDKIKKRILEYLSVCKLRKDLKGPIICLAGPPGVGKTSLGKSIANALGRKFHRISLGGIRDEAEIRGHRRTYVGSMPGVIIQGLKKCGVNNPVFLLDEVDKLCNGSHQGDPAAALLEVLDPEQNNTFLDHYINTPVDLSKVLFIATANNLSNMSAPLLDRMEIVELSGYTINEKRHIAKNHLIPKQVQTHGLTQELFEVPDDTLGAVISKYTREAGVRNLERTIAALCRAKAMDYSQIDQGSKFDKIVHLDDLENILGIPRFTERLADQKLMPGMAIGMVYSQSGSGAIMFLEATKMPGSGKLVLTGKLGQVLQESAQIALSWVKANAYELGLVSDVKTNLLEGLDIHIHLPEGATPKDGPSAGITLISCLVSLFSKTPIPAFLSMTGEVSLRGKVLPVGGIREKVISAHRAGIKTIILPELNRKDVNHQDLPDEVFQDIQFYFVSHISEVLQILFETRFKSKLNLISRL